MILIHVYSTIINHKNKAPVVVLAFWETFNHFSREIYCLEYFIFWPQSRPFIVEQCNGWWSKTDCVECNVLKLPSPEKCLEPCTQSWAETISVKFVNKETLLGQNYCRRNWGYFQDCEEIRRLREIAVRRRRGHSAMHDVTLVTQYLSPLISPRHGYHICTSQCQNTGITSEIAHLIIQKGCFHVCYDRKLL